VTPTYQHHRSSSSIVRNRDGVAEIVVGDSLSRCRGKAQAANESVIVCGRVVSWRVVCLCRYVGCCVLHVCVGCVCCCYADVRICVAVIGIVKGADGDAEVNVRGCACLSEACSADLIC